MRQQLNSYDESLLVAAELRSRCISHNRMLIQLAHDRHFLANTPTTNADKENTNFSTDLPTEDWLGRLTTTASRILGHIITVCMYWVCIAIWIGFGPHLNWSNQWQLYINSATSALMVFMFAFLANVRERNAKHVKTCLDSIYRADSTLERSLRLATGDNISNAGVTIPAPKVNVIQRGINYYADVVGTLVGIGLLCVVLVAWLAIGPALHFSSNWWLLIGTYAGLVGMNDGFVLRNVDASLKNYEEVQYRELSASDATLCSIVGMPQPETQDDQDCSVTYQLSIAMGKICSHEMMVVAGFLIILGLLTVASVLRWNLTGQLICNVPPSLIESFFMLILITGHNISEEKRRKELQDIYTRRLMLLSIVDTVNRVTVGSADA